MLCQACSALNDDYREFCYRCQNKLLVLSGVSAFEEDEIEDYEEQEDLSLDEHLLERVSGLEEIVKRTAETLRSIVEAVQKHERAIFVIRPACSRSRSCWKRRMSFPRTSSS